MTGEPPLIGATSEIAISCVIATAFTARLKIVSLRIAITLQITKRERLEWILEASRRASELG
jgi:hypothetical protein